MCSSRGWFTFIRCDTGTRKCVCQGLSADCAKSWQSCSACMLYIPRLENVTTGQVGKLTQKILEEDCEVAYIETQPRHMGYWPNSRKRGWRIAATWRSNVPRARCVVAWGDTSPALHVGRVTLRSQSSMAALLRTLRTSTATSSRGALKTSLIQWTLGSSRMRKSCGWIVRPWPLAPGLPLKKASVSATIHTYHLSLFLLLWVTPLLAQADPLALPFPSAKLQHADKARERPAGRLRTVAPEKVRETSGAPSLCSQPEPRLFPHCALAELQSVLCIYIYMYSASLA